MTLMQVFRRWAIANEIAGDRVVSTNRASPIARRAQWIVEFDRASVRMTNVPRLVFDTGYRVWVCYCRNVVGTGYTKVKAYFDWLKGTLT